MKLKYVRSLFLIVSTLLVVTGGQSCFAQITPDPSIEIKKQQERQEQEQKRLLENPIVKPETKVDVSTVLLPTQEKQCWNIKNVFLDDQNGLPVPEFKWLEKSLTGNEQNDSPIGKCIGAKGLNLLLKRGQDALIEKGFTTTRFVTREQNIQSGNLTLTVVIGRVRNITLKKMGEKTSETSTDYAHVIPLKKGDILNLRAIEQALESFKKVPTIEADIKIEPTEMMGQSDIVIEWKQAKKLRYSTSLDDAGSPTTGQYQVSGTVSVDNPFDLSDIFYVSANAGLGGKEGPTPKGTQGLTMYYSVPYGYWNLSTTFSASQYLQTVIGAFENYEYTGNSQNFDLTASKVIFRDAKNKASVFGKLQIKRSSNFIDGTEVEVQRRATSHLDIGYQHRLYWNDITIDGKVTFKQGLKVFGALPAAEELFDEGTSQYRMLSAEASLEWPLKWGEKQLKLDSTLKLQKNLTKLTSQEKFSIGGRYSVRGIDSEASLSAEQGFYLQNTLTVPIAKGYPDLYLGLDAGVVSGESAINLPGKNLVGMVLGFKGELKGINYEFFAGKALLKPADLKTKAVYGINFSYAF